MNKKKDKDSAANQKKRQGPGNTTPSKPRDKQKKNTSLRLDKQTLKALKIRAIEQDTSVQKLIEKLIRDYLSADES